MVLHYKILIWIGVTVLAYFGLAYGTPRSSFHLLLAYTALCFVGMWQLYKSTEGWSVGSILLLGLLFRLIFWEAVPALSDDYFRFVWDGRLLAAGQNPFMYLPSRDLSDPVVQSLQLQGAVYEGLNSKNYYSVYPPVHQAVFGIAAYFGNALIQSEIQIIRAIILLFEGATMLLLARVIKWRQLPMGLLVLYAFNPLVIMELTGNLHFEGIMIAFVLLAYLLWSHPRLKWWSCMAMSLAIGTKLLPLMFIPLLWRPLGLKNFIKYIGFVLAALVFMFLPFTDSEFLLHIGSSLDLYFRSFEFNASLYYLLRTLGEVLYGYNPIHIIGPLLGISLFVWACVLSVFFPNISLSLKAYYLLFSYLFMATTVHPWYVVPLLVLGIVNGRFSPMFWSFLVVLSYSHYQLGLYRENYFFITFEYVLLLLLMLWEYKTLQATPQNEGS